MADQIYDYENKVLCHCNNRIDLNSTKIWLTGNLIIHNDKSYHILSSFIRSLSRCDITSITLYGKTLTLNKFSCISQNLKYLRLKGKIQDSDGEAATLGDILTVIPKIVKFKL